MIALFGGAAGSGKTTVAGLWCAQRPRAVHIELDEVRDLIVSGRADPQATTTEQARQYVASVRACCVLARSWQSDGFAVAIGDVFEPGPTRGLWSQGLQGLNARLVVLHPPLEVCLARESERAKGVLEKHIRAQHAAVSDWPGWVRIDSSAQSPHDTLAAATTVLETAVLVDLLGDDV